MSLVNDFYSLAPSRGDVKTLLMLLSPFAPHLAEELWECQGFGGYASEQPWPDYDESKTIEPECEIAVQVGGKIKSTVRVPLDADDAAVLAAATADGKISRIIEGKEIVRAIVVKNRIINLIVK